MIRATNTPFPSNMATQFYRERLWPAAWIYLSTAMVIPASLLVFLPINFSVGVVTAIVLYSGTVTVLLITSPVLGVNTVSIVAGRAKLPIGLAGRAEAFQGEEARLERGQRLDARAWLVIRGWVSPVIKIPVLDAGDPAPYWLISTRHPDLFADAIRRASDARDEKLLSTGE